ncbi:hydrolethalus syndrome protein 1 isoform X1 [Vespula maculifrons]|uniref:Hydrolethalus syndrome protein 1 isoform X1 n=1 Tax=Vespula maculifrons TaxID=7453 RepID=A0ABD2CHN5_VESMC
MSHIKDDPREVLATLNSLGFIGITAPQLKAFMKDLKIYKKIKEHERQQHKEEIRKKIMKKQQHMFHEILSEHFKELSEQTNNNSNSSNFDNESLVKVKIKCIPKNKENLQQRYIKEQFDIPLREPSNLVKNKYKKVNLIEDSCLNRKDYNCIDSKPHSTVLRSKSDNQSFVSSCSMQNVYNANYDINKYNTISQEQPLYSKPMLSDRSRPISAPNILENNRKSRSKSILSDHSTTVRSQSLPRTKSSSCSTQKSFIRPWRLHPEVQKNTTNKKCDPVALYQKYQEEWKQIAFPGEAKHMTVRWAVREKMLGADPHPPPLPRKSASVPILRKK